jgi:MtrB/PioB family decaheme-associated outer membrane protein
LRVIKKSWIILLASAFCTVTPALAPAGSIGSYDYYGWLETGARAVEGNDEFSSKFNEYRDVEEGLFLDSFEIYLDSEERNKYLHLRLYEPAEDDERYSLALGRRGTYRLEVGWDAIPHALSNRAQTLFTMDNGELTIPDVIQSAVRADEGTLRAHLQGARPFDLDIGRGKMTASLDYRPSPETLISVRYWLENREGKLPLGTTRFFEDMITLPAPVDYRTQNIEVKTEYADETYQLQLGYKLSAFDNQHASLAWDNIFSDLDAVGDSSRGRLALYPDNLAHSVSLSGAYSSPFYSTRVVGSFSYGWWRQDEDFLPYTINPAITASQLPATSLKGEMNPLMVNLRVVSRPAEKLTLKAGYRLYDLNNKARSHVWEYVSTDNFIIPNNSRVNLPIEYRKQNADASAAYDFAGVLTGTLFYRWEGWDREHRETKETRENAYGLKLDVKPHKRAILRASYERSVRGYRSYGSEASVGASFLSDPFPGFPIVLPELRKFEQAERERDKASLLLQVTLTDEMSFSVFYDLLQDDYRRSAYGLLEDKTDAIGIDFSFTPYQWLNLWGLYTYERHAFDTRSRKRIGGLGPPFDSPVNDWVSDGIDRVDTYLLGTDLQFMEDKLTVRASYANSFGQSRINTRALGDPASPAFIVISATDYPKVKNRLVELEISFIYSLFQNLAFKAGYRLEKYDETDFQTAGLASLYPADSVNMITLNEVVGDYEAHVFWGTLSYEF